MADEQQVWIRDKVSRVGSVGYWSHASTDDEPIWEKRRYDNGLFQVDRRDAPAVLAIGGGAKFEYVPDAKQAEAEAAGSPVPAFAPTGG